MFCKKCGSPLDEGAKFCGNCGAPVDSPQTPDRKVPPEDPVGFRGGNEPHQEVLRKPLEEEHNRRRTVGGEDGGTRRTGAASRGVSHENRNSGRPYDTGKRKKNLWEEEIGNEEEERQEKREKTVFIVLSIVIVVLVAAIIVGVVLMIRGEQENRQAPQLNEQLRQELQKDDQEEEDTVPEEQEDPVEVTGQPQEDSDRQVTPNPTVTAEATPSPVVTATPTPTPTPTPEVVEDNSDDYILPQSSSQYITDADLAGLSEWEIRVARNEIYARHGRIFTSPDLAEYFSQKSWYVPSIPADQFDNSYLNSIEIANLQVITRYEAAHNLNQ